MFIQSDYVTNIQFNNYNSSQHRSILDPTIEFLVLRTKLIHKIFISSARNPNANL